MRRRRSLVVVVIVVRLAADLSVDRALESGRRARTLGKKRTRVVGKRSGAGDGLLDLEEGAVQRIEDAVVLDGQGAVRRGDDQLAAVEQQLWRIARTEREHAELRRSGQGTRRDRAFGAEAVRAGAAIDEKRGDDRRPDARALAIRNLGRGDAPIVGARRHRDQTDHQYRDRPGGNECTSHGIYPRRWGILWRQALAQMFFFSTAVTPPGVLSQRAGGRERRGAILASPPAPPPGCPPSEC